MKNYLKITMGLVLASMIVSCSDEDNTIVPDTNPDPVIPTEGTFILPAPAVESNIPEHMFFDGGAVQLSEESPAMEKMLPVAGLVLLPFIISRFSK